MDLEGVFLVSRTLGFTKMLPLAGGPFDTPDLSPSGRPQRLDTSTWVLPRFCAAPRALRSSRTAAVTSSGGAVGNSPARSLARFVAHASFGDVRHQVRTALKRRLAYRTYTCITNVNLHGIANFVPGANVGR